MSFARFSLQSVMEELKLKTKYITLDSRSRLYGLRKPIVGLTGGIASGKSTTSNYLKKLGFKIIDADSLIHEIYNEKQTIDFVKELSGSSVTNNSINFKKLREEFFSNPKLKFSLETFLYKRLPEVFNNKVKEHSDQDFIIYDVPLLFEKGLDEFVDVNICVYTTEQNQLKRLIQRDGTDEKLAQEILKSQLNIEAKKEKSQFILNNTSNLSQLETEIQLLTELLFE